LNNERFRLRKNQYLGLFAIVAVAAILRLINLGYESLWSDEAAIATSVRTAESLRELLQSVKRTTGATPMHELILAAWIPFGTSEFMLRFPSFLAGVGSVVAIYFLGRRIFNGHVGLLAALLLAFSRFHIRYSQETRFYAIFGLLAICSIIALLRYIERRTPGRWIVLIATHTLCLYSAYFAAFLITSEALYATYLLIHGRISRAKNPAVTFKTYFALGVGLALAVVSFLPWFLYAGVSGQVARGIYTALDARWLMSILKALSASSGWSVVGFLAAFFAGAAYSVRLRRHEGVLLVLVAVLSPFVVLAMINRMGYFFHPRQVFFALPSFLLLVAAGITGAAQLLGVLGRRLTTRKLDAVFAWTIAAAVFVPLDAFDLQQYYNTHRPDWKHGAAYLLDRNVGKRDIVVLYAPKPWRVWPLQWYTQSKVTILDSLTVAGWYDYPDNVPRYIKHCPPMVYFAVAYVTSEIDPMPFEVASFNQLAIIHRKMRIRDWNDFWHLMSQYIAWSSNIDEISRLTRLVSRLKAKNHHDFAYRVSREAAQTFPGRLEFQKVFASLALEAGDVEAAESAFRQALKIHPADHVFKDILSILAKTGRYDEAVQVAAEAVAAKDISYRRVWLAMMYTKAGEFELAEEQFHKAIAMQPDYAYAHFRFGQFCVARGKLDEAVAEYRTVLELDPKNNVFNFLVNILLGMGKRDEAIEVVRRAVAAKDEPYRRVCLGMVYSASGKHNLGEQEFLRAVEMQPDYEYAHYRLGQFHAMHGMRDEAVAEFETVLRLVAPGSGRANSVRAELEKLVSSEAVAK